MDNKQKKSLIDVIKSFIKEFIDDPIDFMDMIKDMVSNKPKSLNDVARLYSKATDEIIIKAKKENSLEYAGGKLHIRKLGNDEEIEVSIELYFQDDNDNWIKKENKDLISKSDFTEEALEELEEKEEIIYDIETPEILKNSNEESNDLKKIFSDSESKMNFLKGLIYLAKADKTVEPEEYNLFLKFAKILNVNEEKMDKLVDILENKEKIKLDFEFKNDKQSKTLIRKSLQLALIDDTYDKNEKDALLNMNKHLGLNESYFIALQKEINDMDFVFDEGEIEL